MEYRRRQYFYFKLIRQATHSKYPFPLLASGPCIIEIGKLPLRTFPIFLLRTCGYILVTAPLPRAELPTVRFAILLTREPRTAEQKRH